METQRKFTLDELAALADFPKRTIRFYMQNGLVDKPTGNTRASYYAERHLEQLLLIRKWQNAGLSLERIRELLAGADDIPPAPRPRPGDIEVVSCIHLADGISLHINPQQASLTAEQIRTLSAGILKLIDTVKE